MAETESAHSPEQYNHLTRRAALVSTAAVGALALPAGAAVAAVPGDADPRLAAIEQGYARWQEIEAEHDRAVARAIELEARVDDAIALLVGPHPHACGNGCISAERQCKKEPGCACSAPASAS